MTTARGRLKQLPLLALLALVVVAAGFYFFVGKTAGAQAQTACQDLVDKWKAEKPENLGTKTVYEGEIAPVKYASSNFSEVSKFKKEIDEGVIQGPNYNGHYTVVEWSCGDDCQNHAVIDVKTGDVLTFGVVSARGLQFSIDSPILIVNPNEKMAGLDVKNLSLDDAVYWMTIPREYHVIEETDTTESFRLLCAENPFEGGAK